jgi:hypothetical protein
MTSLFRVDKLADGISVAPIGGVVPLRTFSNTPEGEALAMDLLGKLTANIDVTMSRVLNDFEQAEITAVMRQMLNNFSNAQTAEKDFVVSRQSASFQVLSGTKEAGQRWILISSSNRRDRDSQLVTASALERAVMIGDITGFRGPLRWWHTKEKGKILNLGTCDFQMVHKGFLVESGTFLSEAVAVAVKNVQHLLVTGFQDRQSADG